MSSQQHPEIVIVKRRGLHEDEHHGGAWKIAFADFMTAMMAFFLVLWIISATDKNTKTLIARYFNPVKVEEPAKAQKGIHGVPDKDAYSPGVDSAAPNAEKPSPERAESTRAPTTTARRRRRTIPTNAARRRRNRRSRLRIQPSPIRPCRRLSCSATRAPVSTRSPARRRRGPASIHPPLSRATGK